MQNNNLFVVQGILFFFTQLKKHCFIKLLRQTVNSGTITRARGSGTTTSFTLDGNHSLRWRWGWGGIILADPFPLGRLLLGTGGLLLGTKLCNLCFSSASSSACSSITLSCSRFRVRGVAGGSLCNSTNYLPMVSNFLLTMDRGSLFPFIMSSLINPACPKSASKMSVANPTTCSMFLVSHSPKLNSSYYISCQLRTNEIKSPKFLVCAE